MLGSSVQAQNRTAVYGAQAASSQSEAGLAGVEAGSCQVLAGFGRVGQNRDWRVRARTALGASRQGWARCSQHAGAAMQEFCREA